MPKAIICVDQRFEVKNERECNYVKPIQFSPEVVKTLERSFCPKNGHRVVVSETFNTFVIAQRISGPNEHALQSDCVSSTLWNGNVDSLSHWQITR